MWGSNPIVDPARGSLFVGTGNNYSHPTDPAYLACVSGGGTEAACLSPDDHVDSILALDLSTGAVKWATKLVTWNQYGVADGSDDWNVACFVPPFTNCPGPVAGPDYDFGSAPNEITYQTPAVPRRSLAQDKRAAFTMRLIRIPAPNCGTPR